MTIRKNPLTPRETALRLLENMDAEASYGEIIRQVRILQDIDQTINDVDLVGLDGEGAIAEARSTVLAPWLPIREQSERRNGANEEPSSESGPSETGLSESAHSESGLSESAPSETGSSESELSASGRSETADDGARPAILDSLLRRAAWRD